MNRLNLQQYNTVAVAAFIACALLGAIPSALLHHPAPAVAGVLLGLYLLFSIKVVRQWEKAIKLRFGRYVGLRGSGLCLIVPVVETLSQFVDQRVRVANVSAETPLPATPFRSTSTPLSSGWSGTRKKPCSKSRTTTTPLP